MVPARLHWPFWFIAIHGFRLSHRRRGICRQRPGGTAGAHARQKGLAGRPPQSHRRQRLRSLQRRGHARAQIRAAYFPHELARRFSITFRNSPSGGSTSIACWPAWTASCCRSRSISTRSKLYGLNLTSFQVEEFFASVAEKRDPVRTTEDVVVSKVGRELYEKFFRSYTRKQWGLDPSELDAQVTARVPTRTNRDDRYFTRQLPGDAAAWVHAHVREHARSSEHQDHAQHGLPRRAGVHPVSTR